MTIPISRVAIGALVITGLSLGSCTGERIPAPPLDLTSTAFPAAAITTTATHMPSVSTEIFTPVPIATLTKGPTTFEEPFVDNRNGWYTNPTLVDVLAGTYKQILDCPASGYSTHCGNFIQIPFQFPRSFRMQIEATITSASTGAGVMVGFQVRRSDDAYYYVNYVLTKGLYAISRVTQTGEFQIVPETPSDLIKRQVGDANVLGIEINGAELMPLLNGDMIPPVQDGNIRTAGDSYLVVLVERGHTAELYFDNLVVETVDE